MFNRMTPIMDNQPDCGYIKFYFKGAENLRLQFDISWHSSSTKLFALMNDVH